jgi:hypothetical protein
MTAMREHPFRALIVAAALAVAAAGSRAEPVGPALTPKLRDTLREEMKVLVASQDILAALVAGEHATVAAHSQRVHDSLSSSRR